MANIYKTIKLIIKHFLGKDLYLRPTRRVPTRFYGSSYGGWALPKNAVKPDSVVYSFGIGEDASFDLALIEEVGCSVHGFDPTPKSLSWVASNVQEVRFLIHPCALGPKDGMMELWLPENPDHVSASCRQSERMSSDRFMAVCKNLRSIMDKLGHTKIDVLKMDIEGAEHESYRRWLQTRQLIRWIIF
jgi:FkbM family methyltransferase